MAETGGPEKEKEGQKGGKQEKTKGPFHKLFERNRRRARIGRNHSVGLISLISCTVFAVFLTVHVPAVPRLEQNMPHTLRKMLGLLTDGPHSSRASLEEQAKTDVPEPEDPELEKELEEMSRRILLKRSQRPPLPLDSNGPYQGLPPLPPSNSSSSSSSSSFS